MTRRILIGAFPDGGSGVRVSEPGYDVHSNPFDNERAWFNSDWPAVLPVHYKGRFTVANAQQLIQPFPDLGFLPFHDVVVDATALYHPGAPAGSVGAYEPAYTYISLFSGGVPINAFLQVSTFHNYLLIRNYSGESQTVMVTVYNVMAFPS